MSLMTLQPATVTATASGLTTASTTYTAGDMLGGELTLTGMAASSGGRGVITAITVESHTAAIPGAVDLRFFNAASTPAADNAANSWSDANALLQVVGYQVAAPVASALNTQGYTGNLWLPFKCAADANLYLNVITLTAHTFFGAATDLHYSFEVLQWV